MQTKLSQFCDQFVSTVEPLLDPLQAAITALGAEPDNDRAKMRTELADLRLQVEALSSKVAGKRSYVLIFGPLKSGKSTLMNAIAAAYVSEVSSLPAYPCLVFVSHGEKPEFLVTNYRHEVETYHNAQVVHQQIEAAHAELAKHIRAAEDAGDTFDPEVHFPAAIRRVDIRVPAISLEESSAILVDTPGLYTRMRFGYDRMTRDFRNAAACAIFVVKSDTLFLEQVFDEFTQLLELFSRIFLVVNIDTTKRDVGPDGTLVPSLEQADPGRIIKAFEDLAMPSPLRRAESEGRVKIFPVDLMDAASATLRGKSLGSPGFGQFQNELNTYLASPDYLLAFLTDSMQRAQQLLDEADQLAKSASTDKLRAEIREVDRNHAKNTDNLRHLLECRHRDWSPSFQAFEQEVRENLIRVSRNLGARVTRDMSAAIETWFLSSHSLQWLLDTVWGPLIADFHTALDDAARRCLEQSVFHTNAGLDIDETTAKFLRRIGIDILDIRQTATASLAQGPRPVGARFPLDTEQIPLRRGLIDVLLFRSINTVRERLLGPASDPDTKISARHKASRLGGAAKRYLKQFILGYKDQFFKKAMQTAGQRYASNLERSTIESLIHQFDDIAPQLEQDLAANEQRGKTLRNVLEPLERLARISEEVRSQVTTLSDQFASTDLETLLNPSVDKILEPSQVPTDQSQQA